MAKIYNEIVIDMNPESSTFEEVLHEDSFEYSGDMILAQDEGGGDTGGQAGLTGTIGAAKVVWQNPDDPTQTEEFRAYKDGPEGWEKKTLYPEYAYDKGTNAWTATGKHIPKSDTHHYTTMQEANAKQVKGEDTDWGAANITKDMFINADGSTKTIQEIYTTLDPLLPNMTGEKLKLQIQDMLPKYEGVSEEEKGFAREGFQKDVYGVSKDAGKAGAQMQQAYGSGMGSSMRGAIAGQKDVAQQFKQAEQGYAQDVYGLEKKAGADFETGVGDWLQSDWFTTPEGDTDQTTAWDDFREGGKVPTKEETFLDVLSKLPDAGGS
tara:strand:+ start:2160 stop:3125 length:966 start_codon:yes stop_codon:yes gene_type:complete